MNAHAEQRVERYGAAIAGAPRAALTVHGRSQNPEWMREFVIDRLDAEVGTRVAFVAPAAADGTWYPGGFMQELEVNEPHLGFALDHMGRLIDDIERAGHDRSEIVLIGFSQGACLLAEFVARNPARYGGVALLTGGLIGPPGTSWIGGSLDGTPILMGTSDVDEWVPISRAEETRDVLTSRGADVRWHVYEGMDHIINDDEIRLVSELLTTEA